MVLCQELNLSHVSTLQHQTESLMHQASSLVPMDNTHLPPTQLRPLHMDVNLKQEPQYCVLMGSSYWDKTFLLPC